MENVFIMAPDDVEIIAELERVCFSHPWSEKALLDEIENPNAVFLVYKKDNKILGYIGSIFVCGEANITNVAVFPEARKMGVATALISSLIQRARQNNIFEIFLEVRRSNASAQRLYEKCGFCVIGERRGFYSAPVEDAILMKYIIG